MQLSSLQRAQQEAQTAKELGLLTEEQSKLATDLRKEVNGLQEVKLTKELEPNIVSLLSALEKENGVGDISAINSFQRLAVDPGVAVREGDVALLQSAQSYGDRVGLAAKGLFVGNKLTPEAREQMKELAKSIYEARINFTEDNIQPIKTTATEAGIDYNKYIGRPFSTVDQIETKVKQISGKTEDLTDSYANQVLNYFQQTTSNPYKSFGI
jgi:hypothetical protein